MLKPKTFFNPKLFLLILFSLILFFSFLTYWRFREFQKSLSKIEFPKFEVPKIETPFSPAKVEEKEFISPDGKLKLKYGSDWLKMEEKSLGFLNKQVTAETKNLFFAQKLKGLSVGFLLVQEIDLEKKEELEDIVEKIKKSGKEGEVEISNLKIEDKEAVLEIAYKKGGSPYLYEKEKIIKDENRAYIVAVLTFAPNWADFEAEANQILASIQILK